MSVAASRRAGKRIRLRYGRKQATKAQKAEALRKKLK